MKKIIIIISILSIFNLNYAKETYNAYVKVTGLVCSFCAQGIQKSFDKKDSISFVDINMDSKLVTLKSTKQLNDDFIITTIQNSGYNVDHIFYDKKPDVLITYKDLNCIDCSSELQKQIKGLENSDISTKNNNISLYFKEKTNYDMKKLEKRLKKLKISVKDITIL